MHWMPIPSPHWAEAFRCPRLHLLPSTPRVPRAVWAPRQLREPVGQESQKARGSCESRKDKEGNKAQRSCALAHRKRTGDKKTRHFFLRFRETLAKDDVVHRTFTSNLRMVWKGVRPTHVAIPSRRSLPPRERTNPANHWHPLELLGLRSSPRHRDQTLPSLGAPASAARSTAHAAAEVVAPMKAQRLRLGPLEIMLEKLLTTKSR